MKFNYALMSTPHAARYCNTSPSYLEKLRVSGGGPVFIKIGRHVKYDPNDLDDWIRSRRRQSTSDT